MRDIERIPRVLNTIEDIWNLKEDWRFMQLIENFTNFAKEETGYEDLFNLEDDKLIELLEEYLSDIKAWKTGEEFANRISDHALFNNYLKGQWNNICSFTDYKRCVGYEQQG